MWKRIDLTHRIKNDGKGGPTEPEHAVCRRIYGWNGKLWPRFLIAVWIYEGGYHTGYKPQGLQVAYSFNEDKRNPYWKDHGASVAPELVPELIEMLEEAKVELEKQIAFHELMEKNNAGFPPSPC